MKCIDCEFYFVTPEKRGDCVNDGDTTNPTKDVYCAEVDGEEPWDAEAEK